MADEKITQQTLITAAGVTAPANTFFPLEVVAASVSNRISANELSTLISTILGLGSAALSNSSAFATASHAHAIADTTGLQAALDAKSATGHTHAASDITSGTIATARLGSGTANSTSFLRGDNTWAVAGLVDGNYTDLVVSGSGSVLTVANSAITYGKIQNVTSTNKLLGRVTAGSGVIEEITCTAFGRSIIDDADATEVRATLGLGALATLNSTTLTGDVTGSGSSSFAATIANDAVTYAKIQNVTATSRLLGRATAGAGDVEEITIGTNLSLSGTTLNAAGGLADGTYGQIVVSGSGTSMALNTNSEISVSSAATGGNGSQGSPWTGWDAAITWSPFKRYRFKAGYYSFATSPNYLQYGIELIGEPGTYLIHTGTGNAFVMDAGETVGGLWIQNVRVENITVLGNPVQLTGLLSVSIGTTSVTGSGTLFTSQVSVGDSITFAYGANTARSYIVTAVNSDTSLTIDRAATITETNSNAKCTKTRNGFYLRGVRNSVFDRLSVKDVASAAILTEACVTNSLRMFRCTYHEPAQFSEFQCRPQYGIVTSGRGADWSTCWTVEEPVIEGTQIYGIWCKSDSYGNTIINGTSEGNKGIGIRLDGNYNTIINTDVEANTGDDISINSSYNILENVFSAGTVSTTSSGHKNIFLGGRYQNLTIASSAFNNQLVMCHPLGTFTDSGNATLYICKSGADVTSSIGIPRTVIASITASGAMATNVLQGSMFTVSTTVDCTLSAPSNAYNGSYIIYRFRNDSGSTKSIVWNSIFEAGLAYSLPSSVANLQTVYVAFFYNSAVPKWQMLWTNATSQSITLAAQSLTGSQATSLADLATTWNTTGTPSAIKLNVTDTASNAASKLLDVQLSGSPRITVWKSVGTVSFGANASGWGVASNGSVMTLGRPNSTGGIDSGTAVIDWVQNDSVLCARGALSIGRSHASKDLILERDAADVLAQRRGTTANCFRVYNTYTDATTYERGVFDWQTTANTLRIGTEKGSVGDTARDMAIITGDTVRVTYGASGGQTMAEGHNTTFGTTTGSKIGTATGEKIGFWNATPVVQQVLATGASATVDNVISLLQTLGLCKQS